MKYEPFGNKLLVQRDQAVKVSKGGVILADVSLRKATTGAVVAKGDDVLGDLEPGDRVWFGRWGGIGCDEDASVFDDDGQLVISEEEVFLSQRPGCAVTPLDDRVLVRAEKKEKTHRGIIIPDNQKSRKDGTWFGTVLAVGLGKIKKRSGDNTASCRPTIVETGWRVVCGRNWSATVEVDGEELVVVREPDVLGRVT